MELHLSTKEQTYDPITRYNVQGSKTIILVSHAQLEPSKTVRSATSGVSISSGKQFFKTFHVAPIGHKMLPFYPFEQ